MPDIDNTKLIKYIRVRNSDGSYTKAMPFGVAADNVVFQEGETVKKLPVKMAEKAERSIYGDTAVNLGRLEKDSEEKIIEKGVNSATFGEKLKATGRGSFASGSNNSAEGNYSHAEGFHTTASGEYSHAEGAETEATGKFSHAEGYGAKAFGEYSHAEGCGSEAHGKYAHSEGIETKARGIASLSIGNNTEAKGNYSFAAGIGTIATREASFVHGKYNEEDIEGKFVEIIGGGTSADNRKNIYTLDKDGNLSVEGTVKAKQFIGACVKDENDQYIASYVKDVNIKGGQGNENTLIITRGNGETKEVKLEGWSNLKEKLGTWTNPTSFTVNQQEVEIANFTFANTLNNKVSAVLQTQIVFKFTVEDNTDISFQLSRGKDANDPNFIVDQNWKPTETVENGYHIITLIYPIREIEANSFNSIRLTAKMDKGTAQCKKENLKAIIMGVGVEAEKEGEDLSNTGIMYFPEVKVPYNDIICRKIEEERSGCQWIKNKEFYFQRSSNTDKIFDKECSYKNVYTAELNYDESNINLANFFHYEEKGIIDLKSHFSFSAGNYSTFAGLKNESDNGSFLNFIFEPIGSRIYTKGAFFQEYAGTISENKIKFKKYIKNMSPSHLDYYDFSVNYSLHVNIDGEFRQAEETFGGVRQSSREELEEFFSINEEKKYFQRKIIYNGADYLSVEKFPYENIIDKYGSVTFSIPQNLHYEYEIYVFENGDILYHKIGDTLFTNLFGDFMGMQVVGDYSWPLILTNELSNYNYIYLKLSDTSQCYTVECSNEPIFKLPTPQKNILRVSTPYSINFERDKYELSKFIPDDTGNLNYIPIIKKDWEWYYCYYQNGSWEYKKINDQTLSAFFDAEFEKAISSQNLPKLPSSKVSEIGNVDGFQDLQFIVMMGDDTKERYSTMVALLKRK